MIKQMTFSILMLLDRYYLSPKDLLAKFLNLAREGIGCIICAVSDVVGKISFVVIALILPNFRYSLSWSLSKK